MTLTLRLQIVSYAQIGELLTGDLALGGRGVTNCHPVQRKPLASTQSVPGATKLCSSMNSVSASIHHLHYSIEDMGA